MIVPLIQGPVRSGDVQLVYHNFPMSQSGFFLGAYAAVAAAKQDYEWQFIQLFFANQDEAKKHGADQDFLDAIARGVGVVNFNVEQWQRDMKDDDIQATLDADEKITAERRLPAEPAVVVGGAERDRAVDPVSLAGGRPGRDRRGRLSNRHEMTRKRALIRSAAPPWRSVPYWSSWTTG